MKQPIWVFNASVLALFAIFLTYIALYKVKLPPPQSIIITQTEQPEGGKQANTVDASRILANDLFGTYHAQLEAQEQTDAVKPLPPPPPAITVSAPPEEQPKFLDPIPATLTGVIMLHDDAQNRAIIKENKSNIESTYKIGDEIEDAQLVKIFANKVLLIRSNGQQEWLYINQDEAITDNMPFTKKDWSHVVALIKPNTFLVDRQEFVNEVHSLNNAIDLFALSTAYKAGKSIGLKVGKISQTSLANALGLQPGDIITAINDEIPATTEQRLAIYKKIIELADNAPITIELLRAQNNVTLHYILGIVEPTPQPTVPEPQPQASTPQKSSDSVEQHKLKLLRQKEKFAPTIQELRLREKENILRRQKAAQKQKGETDKGK